MHDNLGNALADHGRFDEAIAAYRGALAIDPTNMAANAVTWHHLALVKRFEPGDDDLARMEAGLARADLPATARRHLHYAAGKAYADCGNEPDRAFGHYREGARLQRARLDYDIGEDEALFAEIARTFADEGAVLADDAGHPSDAPIFIVGMPRSGTTLVEQILASHSRVHAAGERTDLTRAVESMGAAFGQRFPGWIARATASDLARLGREYHAAVIDSVQADRITDKMPGNFLYAGLIRRILPNARIIHVVRDPADTCLSCFTYLFGERQAFSYDLHELGRYYRAYAALSGHWRRTLPRDFMLDVRYEDLIAEPEAQIARLLDHCGLYWDPACLAFHQVERSVRTVSASQVRQPLYRSSIGRWRPYRDHLQPLFDALGDLGPDGGGMSSE